MNGSKYSPPFKAIPIISKTPFWTHSIETLLFVAEKNAKGSAVPLRFPIISFAHLSIIDRLFSALCFQDLFKAFDGVIQMQKTED
jgi:hypothetical protein